MTFIYFFYTFFVPFEYLQEKLPKGPIGINYGTIMMVLMIAWWLLGRSSRGLSPAVRSPLNLVLVAWLVWTYLGLILTTIRYPAAKSIFDLNEVPFKSFLQICNGILFFFISAAMLNSRRRMHQCLLAIALAAPFIFRVFHDQLSSVSGWHFNNYMRIRGPFVWIGSNELGAFFDYSALFLGLYAFCVRRLWQRMIFFLAGSIYCYGILYSYSRATQLSFLIAVALIASLRYRMVLLLIAILALTSSVWLPYSVRERWMTTTDEEGQLEESAQSRQDFSKIAWKIFLQSPLYGTGVGSFKLQNSRGMDTHNLYMRTLAEMGLIGFALLMTIWGMLLTVSYRLWRDAPLQFDRHFGFCLFFATLALMITNLFGDRFTHIAMISQYWVIVGMATRLYANMKGYEPLEEEAAELESAPIQAGLGEPLPAGPLPHNKSFIHGLTLFKPRRSPSESKPFPVSQAAAQSPGGYVRPSLNMVGRTNAPPSAPPRILPPR